MHHNEKNAHSKDPILSENELKPYWQIDVGMTHITGVPAHVIIENAALFSVSASATDGQKANAANAICNLTGDFREAARLAVKDLWKNADKYPQNSDQCQQAIGLIVANLEEHNAINPNEASQLRTPPKTHATNKIAHK